MVHVDPMCAENFIQLKMKNKSTCKLIPLKVK